ncbi:MAG: nitroreductase family deazaflavin-dependent oxidoreductase [Acidimicrobiales bacterium]
MLVAVTGGTGFVGSHAVARLVAHGHRPRLLVRDPDKAARVLGTHDIDPGSVELVVGDMGDARAVAELLEGADAVIHAAAAIGVTGPRTDLVTQNVHGMENVVGAAVERGLDPVIHVSTVAVFVPPDRPVITAEGRLASPRTDYGRSKLAAERYARRLQDQGAPVTIVYPGGVVGPHQPTLDAMMEGLAGALGSAWPMPKGGVGVIHVEDLAEALARMVVPGRGPRRFMLGGDFLTWTELADLCDEVTGVPCRRLVVPGWVLVGLGAALDLAKRVKPFDYPLTRDAAEMMVSLVPTDDAVTVAALALERRPARDSIEEALRCLAADGHLAPERAGRLAPAGAVSPSTPPTGLRAWFARHVIHPMAGSALFARVGPYVVPYLDRFVHRVTGGRVVTSRLFVDSLVLTTVGRRTGEPREAPLACAREATGSWLVVGSNFGKEHHPAWTANLLAHPQASVGYRGAEVPVTARLLADEERDQAWADLRRVWPLYDRYEDRAGRSLRVFRLTPR